MTNQIDSEKLRESWRRGSAKYRSNPAKKSARQAYWTEYNSRPEVKEKRRAWERKNSAELKAKRQRYHRERYATDPVYRARLMNYGRIKKCGMSPELFEATLARQNNRCAVCSREFTDKLKAHADHCHDSGKPRGLLCFQCNQIDGSLMATGLTPLEFGKRLHEYLATHSY